MRTAPVLPAIVAAATITLALVHGCTLPLAGLSPSGAGGGATTTSASSAGGARETTAATTSGGGATTTGATTSVTGSSTSSGMAQCATKADCPDDGNCTTYACTAGKCAQTPSNEGMVFSDPSGNCEKTVCVGGVLMIQNDDSDLDDDGNPCTVDGCDNGSPTHVGGNTGNDCGPPGKHCFDGKCLECGDPSQCPQGTDPCKAATCDAGMCGFGPQSDGISCAPANPCKGAGACMSGACVQKNVNNGTSCNVAGQCIDGGCCFVVCESGTVCCGAGQYCNPGGHCKP